MESIPTRSPSCGEFAASIKQLLSKFAAARLILEECHSVSCFPGDLLGRCGWVGPPLQSWRVHMAYASTEDTGVVDKETGIIYRVLLVNDTHVLLESDDYHLQVLATTLVFKTNFEPLLHAN